MALQLTPTPIDVFSRYALKMFDENEMISVPTGFQAFFGNPAAGGITFYSPDKNDIDIDIIRGKKTMSALIPRGTVSRPIGSTVKSLTTGKYTTFNRKFPLGEEEGSISAAELVYRSAGENPYAPNDMQARLREKAMKIHHENIRMNVRMFEYLAMTSLLTGKMPAIIGTTNTDLIYDFRRKTTHTFAPDTKWDASGDILGDIDTACDLLEANGNISGDFFMGMGGAVMSAFIKDTTTASLADNRRFEFVRAGRDLPIPAAYNRFIQSGWLPQGMLRTPKGYSLWLFVYNRTYENASGVDIKLMPEDQVFITSIYARFDRYFGPPETLPMVPMRAQLYREVFGFDPMSPPMPSNILNRAAIVDPSMFYCDGYVSPDWKTVTIRTQTAPIFATTMTDAVVTMTGVVTLPS